MVLRGIATRVEAIASRLEVRWMLRFQHSNTLQVVSRRGPWSRFRLLWLFVDHPSSPKSYQETEVAGFRRKKMQVFPLFVLKGNAVSLVEVVGEKPGSCDPCDYPLVQPKGTNNPNEQPGTLCWRMTRKSFRGFPVTDGWDSGTRTRPVVISVWSFENFMFGLCQSRCLGCSFEGEPSPSQQGVS